MKKFVSISLGDIRFMPTRSEFAIFRGFFNAPIHQNFVLKGGVCACCEKRPFQKCMGGGVGGHSFEHRAEQETTHRTGHCSRDHSLFAIRAAVIVAALHKGGDSIGAHIPLLVTGNILYGEARRPPTGARCTVSVLARAASLKRFSACRSACRNFSNFALMAEGPPYVV